MNNVVYINKKERILALDFIKGLCAIGIILFHFSTHHLTTKFRPLLESANGSWGTILSYIFLAVSGALLYYNYAENFDAKQFYKKRWFAIFPMFYLAYASYEIGNMLAAGKVLFRGKILPYMYTLLGLDGYLNQNTTTYYILGEWFLGMIIAIYLLFPIILFLFKKNDKITYALTAILFLASIDMPILNPVAAYSITTCLFSFVTGMIVMKYKRKILNKYLLITSAILSIVMIFIKLPFSSHLTMVMLSAMIFMLLLYLGEKIMTIKIFNKTFVELSSISYGIFLLQHMTIFKLLPTWNAYNGFEAFKLLLCIIALTLIEAKILTVVGEKIAKTYKVK